ncbi:MAG TPA: sigma-70 family RNA polymerase sigma factor [Gemmatimonadaceae bacterium]|nr:sigma-70 family RNA polymerase sigma factor [Gemmatimonadaceae bacterium]
MTIPPAASAANPQPVASASLSPDLVRRAQAGDMDAFERIYREHSPRVFALCLRLSGGGQTEASELMQDVFIRAWRGLGTFRGDCAFSSWLHRLTVNAMLESARSEKRRAARVLTMEDPDTIGAHASTSSPDIAMDLERAIATLPYGARMAFVLHDVEGYQHQEIADQMGIAVGTVKAQLHRARKLLIKALDK